MGRSIEGEIVAISSREAIQLLRRQNMFVTQLTEKAVGVFDANQWNDSWRTGKRVRNKERG